MAKVDLKAEVSIPPIKPPFIVLAGEPSAGKTSFPLYHLPKRKALYISSEELTGVFDHLAEEDVPDCLPRLPAPTDAKPFAPVDKLLDYIEALRKDDHDWDLVVFDTASSMEPMIEDGVIKDSGAKSLKAAYGGYNAGASAITAQWLKIIEAFLRLRSERNIMVLINCHTAKRRVRNSATEEEYVTNGLRLYEPTEALLLQHSDAVLFLRYKTVLTDGETNKSGQTTKAAKIRQRRERQLICDATAMPGYVAAKNRMKDMPSVILLKEGDAFDLNEYNPYYADDYVNE